MALIYLASPYSTTTVDGVEHTREKRYTETLHAVGVLMTYNIPIYSPIVHCHSIAEVFKLPTDAEFWKRYNHNFLAVAKVVLVLQLPGVIESLGVQDEINYARTHFIPVFPVPHTGVLSVERLSDIRAALAP